MADYYSLLRKALDGLEENTGQSRRKVYEKARSALVRQLQSLEPKLPPSEVTRHRLSLEDAIRKVEQDIVNSLFSPSSIANPSSHDESNGVPHEAESAMPQRSKDELMDSVLARAEKLESLSKNQDITGHGEDPNLHEYDEVSEFDNATADDDTSHHQDSMTEENVGFSGETVHDVMAGTISDQDEEELRKELEQQSPVAEAETGGNDDVAEANSVPQEDDENIAYQTETDSATSNSATFNDVQNEDMFLSDQPDEQFDADDTALDIDDTALDVDDAVNVSDQSNNVSDQSKLTGISDDIPEGEAVDQLQDDDRLTPVVDDSFELREFDDHDFSELDQPRSRFRQLIWIVILLVLFSVLGGAGYAAWVSGRAQIWFNDAKIFVTDMIEQVQTSSDGLSDENQNPEQSTSESTNVSGDIAQGAEDEDKDTERLTTSIQKDDSIGQVIAENNEVDSGEDKPATQTSETQSDNNQDGGQSTEGQQSQSDAQSETKAAEPQKSQAHLEERHEVDGNQRSIYSGKTTWVKVDAGNGGTNIKADANIPAVNLNASISISKNEDPDFPASHMFEVEYNLPTNFHGGGIARLEGIGVRDLSKPDLPARRLIGQSERISNNLFWFALSNNPAEREGNLKLLRESTHISMLMRYDSGRPAVLSLEIGEQGKALIEEALTLWGN